MGRKGVGLIGLVVLATTSVASGQQDSVITELRSLAPEARAVWPGLAAGVDEATVLRRALGAGPYDGPELFRRRYGSSVSRRASEADRRLLGDALTALVTLERAAAARGEPTGAYRASHDRVLEQLERGLRDARRQARQGGGARVESVHLQPRSYPDQLASLPFDDVTRVGLTPAVLLLLAAFAGDDGEASPAAALGPARVLDTLVAGGLAETFSLAGRGGRRGAYRGTAVLLRRGGALRLIRSVEREAPLAADLVRRGDAWRWAARVTTSAGLTGVLIAVTPVEQRLEVEYRAGPDGLVGAWRALESRGDAVLDQGEEVLTPLGAGRGLLAQLRMSDLMAEIVAAVAPHARKGAIPADLLLTTGNAASHRALLTGPEIFPEIARLIAAAEHEVLVQFFVWETRSQAAAHLCEALRELARRRAATPDAPPVRVRFVLNAHPVAAGGRSAWRAFEAQLRGLQLDPRRVDLRLGQYRHLVLGNLHGKAVIVDGRHAILTGANVEVCHDAGQPWFDAGFRVEGEVGRSLRAEFDQLWQEATGEHLPPLDLRVELAGSTPMLVAGRRGVGSPFANGVEDPQGAAFVTAIRNARSLVRIQTPNLNDDAIKAALLHAVLENGVRVELIVPLGFNDPGEKIPGRGGTNLHNITQLRARVRAADPAALERFDVRWYASPAGELIVGNGPWASHCKYATFDRHVAIVGSGNLDTQAINNSRELNVVLDDAAAVQAWDARLFEPNFARAVPVRDVVRGRDPAR